MSAILDNARREGFAKIGRNIEKVGRTFPHVAPGGKWNDQGPEFWVSGFWPGLLLLYFNET